MEEAACLLLLLAVGVGGAGLEEQGVGAYFLSIPFLPFLHQHCQLLGSKAIGGLCEKRVPRLISHVCCEQRKDR